MRKSMFYQPLAVLMALLVAPPVSWLGGLGIRTSGTGSAPFRAAAQSSSTDRSITHANIDLWEGEAVQAYLALHNLPATDLDLIYDVARTDLRNQIRGTMFGNLLRIINKPAADRTVREQITFSQFQKLVQKNEIALYTAAVNEFQRFQSDCHFKLDPDIAKQYNLAYDGSFWCTKNPYAGVWGPQVPTPGYFTAYGFKNSYGKSASDPYYADVLAGTGLSVLETLGYRGSSRDRERRSCRGNSGCSP